MENATKALLISAGVIFAVAIFALVVYIYAQVSGYYQTKESNLTIEQMAEVNEQFAVYNREVSGFELVSLINKAIDFNQNRVYGNWNTEDGNENKTPEGLDPMSISFTATKLPNDKLFKNNQKYTYTGKNSGSRQQLETAIKEMQELESRINASDLATLVSHSKELEKYYKQGKLAEGIKEFTRKDYRDITYDQILKYESYLAFKRGTYDCQSMNKNSVNQITSLTYKQK